MLYNVTVAYEPRKSVLPHWIKLYRPPLSIVSFWITPAHSKERKYHIFRQYWYTTNVLVFTNTGTFQYLGPEVYFFFFLIAQPLALTKAPGLATDGIF